ncbi:MAG: high-affinity iron transporter, partial [Methanobacteriota archaeon]
MTELNGENKMVAFSTASFLLVLRETIEAALIVSILLAYLDKTSNIRFKKDIWIGTIIAVIFSMIGAVVFTQFLGGFEGSAEKLFEGIVMVLAASVLSWMIIWMMRNGRFIKQELQEKVDLAMSEEKKYALISLAFISVFREGIETILFIGSISASEDPTGVLLSALIGALVAVALAIGLFRGVINLDLKKFFNVTSIILILFAAGLFAHGI